MLTAEELRMAVKRGSSLIIAMEAGFILVAVGWLAWMGLWAAGLVERWPGMDKMDQAFALLLSVNGVILALCDNLKSLAVRLSRGSGA